MKRFFDAIIGSNLYISAAALLLAIQTQIQLTGTARWHPYLFLIFFATLFEYNVHRLTTIIFFPQALESPKHQWVRGNRHLFRIVVVISVLGFCATLFEAKTEVLIALAPFAVLTVFYSMPVSKTARKLFRLREIPYLKIFLIAIVWSAVTVLLPVMYETQTFSSTGIRLMLLERFLFVLAITIPFDIRDMYTDQEGRLRTIPLTLGKASSVKLAITIMIAFTVISMIHYSTVEQWNLVSAFFVSGLTTMYFVGSKRLQSSPWYHYGILDGTMIVQALLVLLLNTL